AAVAAIGGVAVAYWATTGSGEGQATAAVGNGTLTLHASFASGALYPGGSVPVTFTADNATATDLRVQSIHLVSVENTPSTCKAADFSMVDVASNTVVLHATDSTHPNLGQSVTG